MLTRVQDTSIASFHVKRDSGRTAEQRAYIVDFIAYIGGDWSIGELAKEMRLEKSTVSARVFELLHGSKELVECPKRKDRVSGVTIRPVSLPTGQGGVF